MKEEDKISEKELFKMVISNIPDKNFKVMIIKILTKLRRRVDELSSTKDNIFFYN